MQLFREIFMDSISKTCIFVQWKALLFERVRNYEFLLNLPTLFIQLTEFASSKKREESFSTSFLSSFLEKPYLLLFAWHRQRRWEIEGRENKIETIALLDNILQTILICTQKKKPQTPIWKSSLTVSFLCNVKFYHLRDSCQKRR